MTLLIGCSGWSYDDWVGSFYPAALAKKKGEWFSYYAQFFKTVEINSTFYRPPGELQVSSWIKKAEALDSDFEYSVKFPELVSHKALVQGDLDRAVFWATSFEGTCVRPLAEAGLFGAALLQLSPYFRNSGPTHECLEKLLDSLSHEKYNYAVEFRHRSWLDEAGTGIDPAVREALRERNVAAVMIDGPGIPAGSEQAEEKADHAYLRLHGRNYDIWYQGDRKKEDDHRLNRYDYLYRKEQLLSWVPRIKRAELREAKIRVYFNNHARAKAVRNAFQLMDLLEIEHKPKEVQLQDQFTLGEF